MHTAVPQRFTYGGETRCADDLSAVDERHRRSSRGQEDLVAAVLLTPGFALWAALEGFGAGAALVLLLGWGYAAWMFRSIRTGRLDGAGLALRSGTIPWEDIRGVEVVELKWPRSLLSSQGNFSPTEGFVNHESSLAVVIELADRKLGLWMDSPKEAEDLVARIAPFLGKVSGRPEDVPEALRHTMRDAEG